MTVINRSAINVDFAVAPAETDRCGAERTDAELLRAFILLRREDAFAELVGRHGPMVMGVCRRALGNRQDAEDALQVTFLILAKNAGSVRRPEMLGSWLFGVARRVARKQQHASARRRAAQTRLIEMLTNTSSSKDPANELLQFLDEEIDRLPSQYRAAIVTCYLEGKTNREGARLLGWPEGTLVTRLNRAKKALRGRAASRGITLSVAGIGAALSQQFAVSETLPPALIASTAKAASLHAFGQGVSTVISARTAWLLRDSSNLMKLAKIKLACAFIALVVLGAGGAMLAVGLVHRGTGGALDALRVDLNASIPVIQDGTADVVVLKEVRRVRAGAFAAARSGMGTAQEDGEFRELSDDRPVHDRRGRIRFAFSSDRFLTRVDFPETPRTGVAYAGNANQVLMFRNLPPESPLAQVAKYSGSALDHKPLNWSVEQIARISPWQSDAAFFNYLLFENPSHVQWRIKRDGQIVRLLLVNRGGSEFAERIGNSKMLIEFDMSHHGMTTLFRFEREAVAAQGSRLTEIQWHQITWRSAGSFADIPVESEVALASRDGATIRSRSSSVVRFDEYALGAVSDEELSAGELGIPEGTPVHDELDPSHEPRLWTAGRPR